MQKNKWLTTALSLLLLSSMAMAQTPELDASQGRLDALQAELDEAQRTALLNERNDERSRSAFAAQMDELNELEMERAIALLEQQIILENQRAQRQAAELAQMAELESQIASQSESLRQARLSTYHNNIASDRQEIERLRKEQISELQARMDAERASLAALQAQSGQESSPASSTPAPASNTQSTNSAPASNPAPAPVSYPAPPAAPNQPNISFTPMLINKNSLLAASQLEQLKSYFGEFSAYADQIESMMKDRKLKGKVARPKLPAIDKFTLLPTSQLPEILNGSGEDYYNLKEAQRKSIESALQSMRDYATERTTLLS